ncbi:hypothetical protein HPO96_22500 [Kribbella sandramycini]|uniref:Uncharacterized protein n=1 Tax=Kribbella sandramycini TaxID=60450 RepID=A0A7Y4P0D1_9ACTN|nr:hypothetical protein [Kribbella sandramycini]MBB6566315.1 hypothetical protein [Kribbella sandramycini]NOL43022.1 hypothetical protein [Kribbella sandramycini]
MSTIDPSAARRLKRQQYAGRPGVLIAAVIATAAQVGFAVATGLGIGAFAETMRHTFLDAGYDITEPWPRFFGPATMGILLAAGAVGLCVSGLIAATLIDRYRGGEKTIALLSPLAFSATAAGVVISSRNWAEPTLEEPLLPGMEESVAGGNWIGENAQYWVPALAVLVAVLVVLWSIRYNRRLRSQITERTRLLESGRQVPGAITSVTIRTTSDEQGRKSVTGADLVIKFSDLQGTERWVTRRTSNRSEIPGVGGFATVLFDPLKPGADESIFVTFQSDPAPGDWIGTVA